MKKALASLLLVTLLGAGLPAQADPDRLGAIHMAANAARSLAAGPEHVVMAREDGTCVAVGNNVDQRCAVAKWKDIVQVAAGANHTVGLRRDGTVVATGGKTAPAGRDGQLPKKRSGQLDVQRWKNVTQVVAGNGFTVGLKDDGTCLVTSRDALGPGAAAGWADLSQVVAVDDGVVGLKRDGTCVATPGALTDDSYAGWRGVVGLMASGNRVFAVHSDGSLSQSSGALASAWAGVPTYPLPWDDAVQVAASARHLAALRADGTVSYINPVGSGNYPAEQWRDVAAITVSGGCTIGLKKDGSVVSALDVDDPRKAVRNWTGITDLSLGDSYVLGVRADGTVALAGEAAPLLAQSWVGMAEVAAAPGNVVGCRKNGTALGLLDPAGCLGNWRDVVQVAATGELMLGRRANGSVRWATAHGASDDDDEAHTLYSQLSDWEGITQLCAGSGLVAGLGEDGTVLLVDFYGLPGLAQAGRWQGIAQLAAGARHLVGRRADGRVVAVGDDKNGQRRVAGWKNIVYVAADALVTLGVQQDGRVVSAGRNDYALAGIDRWQDIVKVWVSADCAIGLDKAGQFHLAGLGDYGQHLVEAWHQ